MIFLLQETEAQRFSDLFKLSQKAEWHNRAPDSQFSALYGTVRKTEQR